MLYIAEEDIITHLRNYKLQRNTKKNTIYERNIMRKRNCLLATTFDEKLLKKFPSLVYFQPKLRGMRCLAKWEDEGFSLYSSTGLPIKFHEEVKFQLGIFTETFREYRTTMDGELYLHGLSQEEINGIGKRTSSCPNRLLEYHIFDIADESIQSVRMEKLSRMKSMLELFSEDLPLIKIVKPYLDTRSSWVVHADDYVRIQGYEGLIIRDPYGFYEHKKSKSILKFKPTEVDEYTIINCIEGTGWAKDSLGAFKVQDTDGTEFNVGTGRALTKASRKILWERRSELIG
ncbi:hypothetical protein GF406_23640, partial [candidate division KSB1 bacterium]|nr:hypothetical protein [candidate division KSB1 bacterium]